MSKELEALNYMIKEYNKLLNKYNLDGGFGDWYNTVKKALTPPTADEVCKQLSDELGGIVIFNNGEFEVSYEPYCYQSICIYEDGKLTNMINLPPHLITLIGRFYEGLGVTENVQS